MVACVAIFSVSFQASESFGTEVAKISGRGDGQGRKSLLLSPYILPNAPNCFCSLGTSAVTRDRFILTSGKIETTKTALKSAGRGLKNVEVWRPRIAVFVSAHLKRSLEVSLKRKDIYLAKIYSSLPTEKIVVESC